MRTAYKPVLFLGVASLFFLIGCGKDTVDYEHASQTLKPEGYSIEGTTEFKPDDESLRVGGLESLDETGVDLFEEDPLSEEYRATYGRSTAPLQPVYFAFDSSAITTDQLEKLNQSSAYLFENKSTKLVVEGNCDERGTADYNLALGELRAMSVKKYLANMGVAPERISTISYGSERPLYSGSDESAWAKNRRADLVIP